MVSASKSVAFVLVPGSFCSPDVYHKVVSLLALQGYEAFPTPLLSANAEGKPNSHPATMHEDAAHIHEMIQKLVAQDKDVVVAMNSYGGFPGTEATKGLAKKEGEKAGVIGLVYLASFIPPLGGSLRGLMGENLPDSIKNAGEYMHLNPSEDAQNIFSDLPEEARMENMKYLDNHSTVSFAGELTYAGWKDIPTTFLLTEGDQIIPPENQRAMISMAQGEGVNVKVVKTEAGHVPMIGVPEEVVEVLINAAS